MACVTVSAVNDGKSGQIQTHRTHEGIDFVWNGIGEDKIHFQRNGHTILGGYARIVVGRLSSSGMRSSAQFILNLISLGYTYMYCSNR